MFFGLLVFDGSHKRGKEKLNPSLPTFEKHSKETTFFGLRSFGKQKLQEIITRKQCILVCLLSRNMEGYNVSSKIFPIELFLQFFSKILDLLFER
jgi:hypothetical protein